ILGRSGRGKSVLLLIFEGTGEDTVADANDARALCLSESGRPLGEAPARAWLEHRYAVSYRQAILFRSGAFADTLEVAAPWSKVEGLYRAVRDAMADHVLVSAHASHAYPDGSSLYFTFSGAGRSATDASEIHERAWRDALRAAIGAGGTISHHHGVGRSK